MADWGRIHSGFDEHSKVRAVSNGAIGLWTKCNSWSRRNRTAGFIPNDVATCKGAPHEICELVEAGLWDQEGDDFRFHQWEEHNGDEKPRTLAAKIVQEFVPSEHPSQVRQRLAVEVSKLLEDGTEAAVIARAIKLWLSKPHAGVSLLPHLVSDALRATGNPVIELLLREAWRSGDMTPLLNHGYVYEPPEIPADATVEEARAINLKAKRAQVTKWQKELK